MVRRSDEGLDVAILTTAIIELVYFCLFGLWLGYVFIYQVWFSFAAFVDYPAYWWHLIRFLFGFVSWVFSELMFIFGLFSAIFAIVYYFKQAFGMLKLSFWASMALFLCMCIYIIISFLGFTVSTLGWIFYSLSHRGYPYGWYVWDFGGWAFFSGIYILLAVALLIFTLLKFRKETYQPRFSDLKNIKGMLSER